MLFIVPARSKKKLRVKGVSTDRDFIIRDTTLRTPTNIRIQKNDPVMMCPRPLGCGTGT